MSGVFGGLLRSMRTGGLRRRIATETSDMLALMLGERLAAGRGRIRLDGHRAQIRGVSGDQVFVTVGRHRLRLSIEVKTYDDPDEEDE